ncbi:hypothetical protein [Amycolatopsis sp. NPDC051371]|uniref:hypothetical protein n=1 Tax=Amycolatopsis sp. NPDC051371 TaxID=3155800 RepID=UPI00341D6333
MASPDTDELATVPTPASAPDAKSGGRGAGRAARQERAEPAAEAEAKAVPQQQTEPLATASGDQRVAAQQTEPPTAGSGAAEAQQQTEPLATASGDQRVAAQQTEPPSAGSVVAEAQQQTELLATGSGVAEAQQQTELLATGSGVAEAQQQTEPLAFEPGEAQTVPQERVEPELIEPADPTSADVSEAAEPAKPGGRWWRGFTGSLAAGLTVLAIGVLVVAGIDLNTGAPGPGAVLLIGHPLAAILALLAQRVADRRNGAPAAGAGVAVVLFTVSALTLFWLT